MADNGWKSKANQSKAKQKQKQKQKQSKSKQSKAKQTRAKAKAKAKQSKAKQGGEPRGGYWGNRPGRGTLPGPFKQASENPLGRA